MSKTARAETMAYVRAQRTEETFTKFVPDPSEYAELRPNSAEALRYWKSLKPRRYASLGRTIGNMLGTLFTEDTNHFQEFLAKPPAPSETLFDPWQLLAARSKEAFHQARESVTDAATYRDSLGFAKTLKELFPDHAITLETQLEAGGETASSTMLTTLRSMPRLVGHHDPGFEQRSLAATARQSVGLPWRMAMVSINRMLIIRHNTTNSNSLGWNEVNAILDPTKYELNEHVDGTSSLHYVDGVEDAEILHAFSSTPTQDQEVIGCPITLAGKYMHKMWNSYIDVVDSKELWTPGADPLLR